jgi:hypothetical protein
VQQTDLRNRRIPVRLAFADHMDCFVAGDRAPSSPEGAKMLTGAYPALDRPMILFQNVMRYCTGLDADNSPSEIALSQNRPPRLAEFVCFSPEAIWLKDN